MGSKQKQWTYAGALLSLVGILFSLMLVCKHNFPELCAAGSFGCSLVGGVDGCMELGKSPYSKLFGIRYLSISVLGLIYYIFLFLSFLRFPSGRPERDHHFTFLAITIVFGLFFVFGLALVNFLVLPTPCTLCAYSYPVIVFLTILLYMMQRGEDAMKLTDFNGVQNGLKGSLSSIGISIAAGILVVVIYSVFAGVGKAESGADKLLPESQVELMLSDLRSFKEIPMDERGLRSVEGKESAYIVIHKFADFRCPHCYHASELLKEALKRWPGRIKIYYRHFPLDGTCNHLMQRKGDGASCLGAKAALCAASAGEMFVPFYHGVFDFQATNTPITEESLSALTAKLHGDWGAIKRCMGQPSTMAALRRDIEDAKLLEINATPTLVVQNRLLPSGSPDRTYFLQLMDALVFEREGKAAFEEYAKRTK